MTHIDIIESYLHEHRISYAELDRRCRLGGSPLCRICSGSKRLNPVIALAIQLATGLDGLDLLNRQMQMEWDATIKRRGLKSVEFGKPS